MAVLDDSAFAMLTADRRRELQIHCYRMLASFEEAEDAVQETYLRAWRARASFAGSTLARAWLYKIATNVCLDLLRTRARRVATDSFNDLPWLARRAEWMAEPASGAERDLLDRFMAVHERCDAEAAIAAAAEDIRVTMPPAPYEFDGIDAVGDLIRRAFGPDREGDWRLLPTVANRMPTAASYLRRTGDTEFRAFELDVLLVLDARIAEITTFGPSLFPAFGLPAVLSAA